jgi:uncharacterized membrane protein YphA (DoxX/SURF4 family)
VTWRQRILTFLFRAESDRWLTTLRIGLGLVVFFYAWPLRADWNDLFAGKGSGLVSRELFEGLLSTQSPLIPRLGWLVWICQRFGLSESFALSLAWVSLLGAGCLLLVGLFSRPVAVLAWFLQLAAAKSGGLFSYGADNFITIGLFYLMIAPLPDRWSLDWWRRSPRKKDPHLLGFHRRVLQIHLCFIYFFGGLTKCLGAGWWDGSNIWRALTSPPFDVLPIGLVAAWSPLLAALGISVWVIEMTYAFLIWPRWTRDVVLCAVCVMHAAIGLLMGMYLFALIMLVLNVAAFGITELSGEAARRELEVPTKEAAPQIARQSAHECRA